MTQFLPANLLALFSPRDPLPYLPPPVPKHTKEECSLTGIGRYAHLFEDPEDTPEPQKIPTRAERQEAKRKEKAEIKKKEVEEEMKNWDPHNDPNATGDAFKTVFVSRINYDTREEKLRREFEEFGYIRKIHMVQDYKTNKPRGYAFIEYETEKGMRSAFKYGDGRKIDGRRVVVDIERGRTVKNWKPRKFGGGLGGTRIGAPDMNITHSGRVDPRQYQEKLARAQRMREREINMESKDEDRGNSRGRSLSRDTSVDRARSERNKSEKRDVSYDRRGKDDDRDRRRDRRDDRDRDRGDDRRRDRDRDDNRRRDRDDDRDRRRDKDRGGDDDRRRDRRDDDRKRDRSRRDRDGDREDRDRDREKDRDRDSKKEYSSEKYNDDNTSTLNDTINIKDEKNL